MSRAAHRIPRHKTPLSATVSSTGRGACQGCNSARCGARRSVGWLPGAARWMRQRRPHASVGKENAAIFSRNHETFKVEQSRPVGADGYDKPENRPRGWRYLDGRPHHNFRISIRPILSQNLLIMMANMYPSSS
jgi:hypothetical protein